MLDFSKIKNEKVRGLLKNSLKFQLLPKEKKSALFTRIIKFSPKQQNFIYSQFLEDENEKESPIKIAREAAFKTLLEKMKQANRTIKTMASQDKEHSAKQKEQAEEDKLLSELQNL